PQTFLGGSALDAALLLDTEATARRLALEMRGGDFRMRLYYGARTLELTFNARWNGTAWERDSGAHTPMRLVLARDELRFQQLSTALATPFADSAWASANAKQFVLDPGALGFGDRVTG